jgi:HJR/Mrr/RecB family endonuclease
MPPSTFEILTYIAELAFDFWPLLIFSPLGASKRKRKRGNLLVDIFAAWVLCAVLRILILFVPEQMGSLFIPEPLSTNLFIVVGIGLFVLLLLRRVRSRRLFQQKTGSVRSVEDLLALSPTEFEEMVVQFFNYTGYKAKRTGSVGDHGVDVMVEGKDNQRWVVQCKRWRGSVGEPMVRDFYGTMQHHKADRGFIISAGTFTRPAKAWAKGKPIILYDGEQFLQKWWQAQKKRATPQTASPVKEQAVSSEAGR